MNKAIIVFLFLTSTVCAQTPLTNTFTYQGELVFNNTPANGSYDFFFNLYSSQTGAGFLDAFDAPNVTVTNGIFTLPITLTNDIFTGNKVWMAITVKESSATTYEVLNPRQEITSSPYAIHAQFVGTVGADAVTGVQIANGSITASDVDTGSVQARISGTCAAGNYIQSVNADGTVNCVADNDTIAPSAWELGGNTASLGNFIGTTNNVPLVFKVNNSEVVRMIYATDQTFINVTPNFIFGNTNTIPNGTTGSTISGGQQNFAQGLESFIGGGFSNATDGIRSVVAGGSVNTASGDYSAILGGRDNRADGDMSFAAGRRAIVRSAFTAGNSTGDQGTFVWADSTNANYTSSGSNQFLVRASGGMVLTDNSANNRPFFAQLFIDGSRDPIQARINGFTKFRVHSNGGVSIGDNGTPPANGLRVSGNITKGGGSFKIDHPLDPEHKYLSHSFVESPDMMNVYNGNIMTDKSGDAWVQLPDWFEALNRDFRYQLTVIGSFARAMVAKEMSDNQFLIKTDFPNVKVSWQITGIRHDHFANKNRIPVEEIKPKLEQGTYLHPAAWEITNKSKWLTTVTEKHQGENHE